MKKVLLDNAYEAWISAIKYCNLILDGECSLQTKKIFVSSLHNSSELFFKQIMLDSNNYSVMDIAGNKKHEEPYKNFFEQTDLNQYFSQLSNQECQKFYSIGYGKIKENLSTIIKEYLLHFSENNLKVGMELLQKLRNQETHFSIDGTTFLLEIEFQQLHNFMCELYQVIEFYKLLPFWGKPMGEWECLWFDKKIITNFTYYKSIIDSKTNNRILEEINGEVCPYNFYDSNYSACEFLYGIIGEKLKRICSFEELVARMLLITKMGEIQYQYEENIDEDDEGVVYNHSFYIINVVYESESNISIL